MSTIRKRSGLKDFLMVMACSNGVYTNSSFITPAITFFRPLRSPSMALSPILLARILSLALGAPPLWMCPSVATRMSASTSDSLALFAISIAPPISSWQSARGCPPRHYGSGYPCRSRLDQWKRFGIWSIFSSRAL